MSNKQSRPVLETITGLIEAMSISPDNSRLTCTIREDDGRYTYAVATGERALAQQALFRCGERITLRGFDQSLAGGGQEFMISEVWTVL